MDRHTVVRFGVLSTAAVVLALTRLPAESGVIAGLAVVTTVALVASAGLALWEKAPARAKSALFLFSLLAVLVPPSTTAWMAGVPHWMVALWFLVALHVFFQDPGSRAPRLDSASGAPARVGLGRQVLRFLPATLFGLALIVVPLAYGFLLPLRVHAAFELQTAFAPIFVVLILGSLVAALGVLRVQFGGMLAVLRRENKKDVSVAQSSATGSSPGGTVQEVKST